MIFGRNLQCAHIGLGIHVGNADACDQIGSHFDRVIHIWHPKQKGHCQRKHDRLSMEWLEGTNISNYCQVVWDYSRVAGSLLIHCAAGMGRSPTLCLLALASRGLHPKFAFGLVADAMWTQYVHKRAPEFKTVPGTDILSFLDRLNVWDSLGDLPFAQQQVQNLRSVHQ